MKQTFIQEIANKKNFASCYFWRVSIYLLFIRKKKIKFWPIKSFVWETL